MTDLTLTRSEFEALYSTGDLEGLGSLELLALQVSAS